MARSRKGHTAADSGHGQRPGGQAQSIQFVFINVYFNTSDQQYLVDNYADSPSRVFDWLAGLPGGYKLSVSLDKVSGRFNATLACSLIDDPNSGKILSVRGATPAAALWGLCYADDVKLEGAWEAAGNDHTSLFG